MSTRHGWASTPRSRSAAAACSTFSLRPEIATSWPRRASSAAISYPIPDDPPVMTAKGRCSLMGSWMPAVGDGNPLDAGGRLSDVVWRVTDDVEVFWRASAPFLRAHRVASTVVLSIVDTLRHRAPTAAAELAWWDAGA